MPQSDSLPEIGLVLYPECQMASVHGLGDMFNVANHYAANHGSPRRLRCSHWQLQDGDFRRGQDSHPGAPGAPAVLVVPGRITPPLSADEAAPWAGWLRDRRDGGATLASVCVGAYLLGHSGVLAGRRATTHWFYAEAFQSAFPETRVTPGDILVEDGDILTAAGMMAWTDLGLRLIHRFLGPTVMGDTARFLLVDPAGREQRHYSRFAPRLDHGDAAVLKLQRWLQARGGRDVSIPAMAAEAGLEPRTFLRRFRRATGHRPTEYVQELRVALARERLEFSRDSVDRIAFEVGYEDAAAFRKVFQRITGLTASAYRDRFGTLGTRSA